MQQENETGQYPPVEQEAKLLAAVGYVPMLFFLPLLVRPRDSFCRFHGVQSLILISALMIFWIGVSILDLLFGKVLGNVILIGFIFKFVAWMFHHIIGTIVSLIYIVITIAGLVKAAAGQYWRVPLLSVYIDRWRGVR